MYGDTRDPEIEANYGPSWYREWIILPRLNYVSGDRGIWNKVNDYGEPWKFELQPTDRIRLDSEQERLQREKLTGSTSHRSEWTLCREGADPKGRALYGPVFERHRLGITSLNLVGLYTKNCLACLHVMWDVRPEDRY